MTKTIGSLLGGFIVGILIIWAWNVYSNRTPALDVPAETTVPSDVAVLENGANLNTEAVINESIETVPELSTIDIRDQLSGNVVNIAAVTLELDGWIVVHEERDGVLANALGAARRDAGTHENITIPLLRNTEAEGTYWIVLYSDNGDRQFNLTDDFPLRNNDGNPFTRSFNTQ